VPIVVLGGGTLGYGRADPTIFRVVRVVAKQKLKYLSSEFNREISALLMSRDSVALMRNSVALTEGVQGTHLNLISILHC